MVSAFHASAHRLRPRIAARRGRCELAYMPLPSGMRTYEAHLPDVDDPASVAPALATLADIAAACAICAAHRADGDDFDLSGLEPASRALMAETLGQGEVSMKLRGVPAVMVQESVFAGSGCWRATASTGSRWRRCRGCR